MLKEDMISRVNLSQIEKNIKSDKYKTYAHNLKYFKEYIELSHLFDQPGEDANQKGNGAGSGNVT